MPSDTGTYTHCLLCRGRVDHGFERSHRGEIPSKAGVELCPIVRDLQGTIASLEALAQNQPPVPMILTCPACGARHIDKGEFATTKFHHTHACQKCGLVWRPAVVHTVGVQFLPNFKDPE